MKLFLLAIFFSGVVSAARDGDGNNGGNGKPPAWAALGFRNEADMDENMKGSNKCILPSSDSPRGFIISDDCGEAIDVENVPSVDDVPQEENWEVTVHGDGTRMLRTGDRNLVSRELGLDFYSLWRSEEGGIARCTDDGTQVAAMAAGMGCRGAFCDDVRLMCGYFESHANIWTSIAYTGWVSEEGSATVKCPLDHQIVEVFCDGAYCDNLSFKCQKTTKRSHTFCRWGSWYSEENGGAYWGSDTRWFVGIQCDGPFCDNKRNLYC